MRRERRSGPAIARHLGLALSTVALVLRRLGLNRIKALDPKPDIIRYQREHPVELIHIDIKKLGRIDAVGLRITGDLNRAGFAGCCLAWVTLPGADCPGSRGRVALPWPAGCF